MMNLQKIMSANHHAQHQKSLSCDKDLKTQFKETSLSDFWISMQKCYPSLAKKALKYLLPFCSTYLCERAFSSLVYIKNKQRNRLNVELDLRIYIWDQTRDR